MSPESLTSQTVDEFKSRLENLTPDSERIFGTLDPAGMMRHMRNVMETALEEVTHPNKTIPIVGPTLFFIFCNIITTWPGGKIKAPAFWTPPAEEEFEKERELIFAAMDRFLEKAEKEPTKKVQNPFFGKLTMKNWALLTGVHLHHHLRQFSV